MQLLIAGALTRSLAKEAAGQTGDIENMKTLEHDAIEATQWWAFARKAVRDPATMHAEEKPATQQ
jgi:hypothetical protein